MQPFFRIYDRRKLKQENVCTEYLCVCVYVQIHVHSALDITCIYMYSYTTLHSTPVQSCTCVCIIVVLVFVRPATIQREVPFSCSLHYTVIVYPYMFIVNHALCMCAFL